jgi:TIR domain
VYCVRLSARAICIQGRIPADEVIGRLDPSIKQYADSLYEKTLFESGATVRRESAKYLQERSKTQDHRQLFSGTDYQVQIRVYADHIERCTLARLDSYQKAFSEINRPPTAGELREILADFKATWDLQIRHSNQALSNYLAARNAPAGLDLLGALRANSAHGHDRVLQEWKVWRGRILLQKSTAISDARSHKSLVALGPTVGAVATGKTNKDSLVRTAFISYSWDDDAHSDWVRVLAERLRADGVDVSIDRWGAVPGDQLTAFMERAIRENQFVVIICTPRYKCRSDNCEGGVGYEGDIMTAEIMTSQNQRKFIPVLRKSAWSEAAPSWLLGKYYINLSAEPYSERDYKDLVRTLLGIRETAPPVGKPMSTIAPKMNRESLSSEFQDIKITRVIVEEVTEPRNDGTSGSALYSVPFALSVSPHPEWVRLFIENWNHPPRLSSMHRPGIASVDGATITLDGTTIDEVERYHRDTLQLAIAETNRRYRESLREGEQGRAGANSQSEEHRKRIEDTSQRIKFD